MDIWDQNKLFLFIAFVVPGFISLKSYELLCPQPAKVSSQQLIDAVAYSCINYAIFLFPIWAIEAKSVRTSSPNLYVSFYVGVLLIAPVFWAFLLRWMRRTKFFQNLLPHPTAKAWDYIFGQRKSYWVIVSLKDGKKIGGRYAANSFATSSPAAEQIYLEECWVVNDANGFERQRTDTAGILILSAEIVTVEFFNITNEESNEQSENIQQRLPARK